MLKCFWAETALLENPEVFAYWLNLVNAQRREKVLRCKQEKSKQRSLLAGVLLKKALETEGLCYEEIEFGSTKEGRPMLLSHPQLHISLSHAGDYACCLIGDAPLGVDMESLERSVFALKNEARFRTMMKKCLTEHEQKDIDCCPDTEKRKQFAEYWTKKEAYSKYTGKGLGMDFSTIDTKEKPYYSTWISENCCLSIYQEKEEYEELLIRQVTSL